MKQEFRNIEWFLENIGKTIYGTSGCSCSVCHMQYLRGVKISDPKHANALFCIQENTTRRYFLSKEERLNFERTLKG